MSTPILATKLYIPPPRPKIVLRSRLIEQLNAGLHRKLTLISAAAGFGKTTLVSEWVADCQQPVAWLSLDEGDSDPIRFLTYLVAALQTLDLNADEENKPAIGVGVAAVLQSPQPPSTEAILTVLLNEVTAVSNKFILILDDYHLIDAKQVDKALTFLLEHMPPQMHLVITTREDPNLPLARLRVRNQMTELRAIDLRFSIDEAAGFLNSMMDLNLVADEITALENRTEGWVAGLQLAALALQGQLSLHGQKSAASFIQSFTGSHRFLLDYLVEEVLQQQSAKMQTFLLQTSILDRLCGSLCDAVLGDFAVSGQEILAILEQANLFVIPLDNERLWYRYHHLFASFLRQRLQQNSTGDASINTAELHKRASIWYEENDLAIEAFQHAVAADDVDRAARLVEGEGMPLIFRGAAALVLDWLASLPTTELDARPSLWVIYASGLLFVNQTTGIEQKLQSAEAALNDVEQDEKVRDLIGHIASIRATLAAVQNDVETIITQSDRALTYLHPGNLPVRTATSWTLGVAYQLQGDRVAASQAYSEAIAISREIGHFIITIMASIGLGNVQESDNALHQAAQTYQRVLQLTGEPALPVASEAHFGLARIHYEWNDLDAAQRHGQQSAHLAQQIENNGRFIACQAFLARLKLAQGDTAVANTMLNKSEELVRQHDFVFQMPGVTAVQILILLQQGNLTDAAHLAQAHNLPISQARVHLAQGNISAALALLEPLHQQAITKNWADERLKLTVLQAVAYYLHGEKETSVDYLTNALTFAEPSGFIRVFVDEGGPMMQLLSIASAQGIMPNYTNKLLAAFGVKTEVATRMTGENVPSTILRPSSLVEPLSTRELEILKLVAQGLSNREISEQLFLALSTVKGHNRNIYGKLQVQRRTEAVARARELGLV